MKRTYHRCSNPICGVATDKPGLCVVCQIEAEDKVRKQSEKSVSKASK